MSFLTIYVKLTDPKGKPVTGQILIRNGYAMSVFSDKKLARKLYEVDKNAGEDVAYSEKYNAFIQRYKGLTSNMIAEKIRKELKKAGAKEFKK